MTAQMACADPAPTARATHTPPQRVPERGALGRWLRAAETGGRERESERRERTGVDAAVGEGAAEVELLALKHQAHLRARHALLH